MFIEFLINFSLGVLGIVVFIAWNSKEYIQNNTFNFKLHIKANWKRWLWANMMLLLFSLVITIEPKLTEAIKTFSGLDLANEHGAYFSAGLALAGLVKGVVKKSI